MKNVHAVLCRLDSQFDMTLIKHQFLTSHAHAGIPTTDIPEVGESAIITTLIARAGAILPADVILDGLQLKEQQQQPSLSDVISASANAIKCGCVMHELNRQSFVKHGVVPVIMRWLAAFPTDTGFT